MQIVIPAAGKSSRMVPFTDYAHKSLISICGKTILEHTIDSIKKSGITDIILVVADAEAFQSVLGVGKAYGVTLQFVEMKEPTGAGDALLLAAPHITGDFFLVNPSRVDFNTYKEAMGNQLKEGDGVLLGCAVEDVEKYGILNIQNGRLSEIVEKPKKGDAPSNMRAVGIYLFKKSFLDRLKMTPKDHYSLEQAICAYAKDSVVRVHETTRQLPSEKYTWDLLGLKKYILEQQKPFIAKTATIAKNAVVDKDAIIDEGAKILENAIIKGKCYIGKNAFVGTNAIIRDHTSLEEGTVVGARMEIKNTLILENTTTHSGYLGDSVVGKKTRIAGDFVTGNVRLDRKNITVTVGEEKIDTGLRALGTLIGAHVSIGIRVSTMPGVIIGSQTIIGPGTTVLHNVDANKKYYTKFAEFIEAPTSPPVGVFRGARKIILFDIDYTLFDTAMFKQSSLKTYQMYEEVEDVLKSLRDMTIGIFSEGELGFQTTKLLETKIHRRFSEEHIHITENKEQSLPELLQQYKHDDLYLVDDKLPILSLAKKLDPFLTTIWVKRGVFAENQEPIEGFTPDAEVSNLRDIIPIVGR